MYSVLIQNKKTIESFHEFHPLFLEALGDKMDVCRWMESGTTIDTALPELSSLTNDKKEWRAVIVHVENEEGMSKFPSTLENPYDFLVNETKSDSIEESQVPLIRLTHMLGGVPAPEIEYEPKEIREEYKVPRVIYVPKRSAEKEIDHANLSKKYEYDGKLPTEILLVTLRNKEKMQDKKLGKSAWTVNRETNSSEFWRRNNYPSVCRFLVYDYMTEGPVKKKEDMFNFWTSVLLLATNDIDASSLQAYKLYTVNTRFNREKMAEVFRAKIVSMLGVRNYVSAEIRKDIEQRMAVSKEKPNYSITVPVMVDLPDRTDLEVNASEFSLCAKSELSERAKWRSLSLQSERKLEEAFKKAERALEESADKMRTMGKVDEDSVSRLDRFQEQDMVEELEEKRKSILKVQSSLPNVRMEKQKSLNDMMEKVQRDIVFRIERRRAWDCAFLLLCLAILSVIPAVLITLLFKFGTLWGALCFGAALLTAFLLVEFAMLAVYKYKFEKKIEKYNDELDVHIVRLSQNVANYANFASDIASYARGKNYLEILGRKKFMMENSYSDLQKHYRAANAFVEKIREWGIAFFLDINHDIELSGSVYIDTDTEPQRNVLYSFEESGEYLIPLNTSGNHVTAPFAFISRLEINREELYEDERTAD